jgi:PAS domain S-box-containing protein
MNRPLRVLYIEDSQEDAALLTRHLSGAGYEPISARVETHESLKTALGLHEWDVILCDYSMSDFSVIGALALVKESNLDIPFIVISGTVGEAIAVEAMRAGAHDFLTKDNLAWLGPTIERELREATNRRARRETEALLRKCEERYRRLEERYRRLLDTTNEGVWAFDAELTTSYVNRRLAEMLQVTPSEMIGRPALDFLDVGARSDVEQRWHRRAQGVKEQYDLHLKRADGTDLWTIVCATPIFDREGKFVGGLSMVTDITERKRAEEKLRESEERYRNLAQNAYHSHELRGDCASIKSEGSEPE